MKLFKELGSLTDTRAFKIGGTIALILLIPLTVFIAQQQQDLRQRAQQVPVTPPNPQVLLSFSSSQASPSSTFSVYMMLDSAVYPISGVDITVTYNPGVLSLQRFAPGTRFNSLLYNTIDTNAGILRYAAVETITKTPPVGRLILGQLTFFAKKVGIATVNAKNMQVTATNFSGNVPVFVVPQTYTIYEK